MNRVLFTNNAASVLNDFLADVDVNMRFAVVDSNTAQTSLPLLSNVQIPKEHIFVLTPGEESKCLDSAEKLWRMFVNGKARRDSVLINIGGGVVTDLGGFAASCYKRGMRCVNVPTTLLAQLDASVGGKTGVNFCGLKNEIGTFAIPELVVIDNTFLKTLPYDEVISGYAEMLKHALLCGYESLYSVMDLDLTNIWAPEFLSDIQNSVAVKERIVDEDPQEKGMRKALNLGHTVGHALESFALENGEIWYHGHSVAYGLIAALYLSVKKFGFSEELYNDVRNFILKIYPSYPLKPTADALFALMLHDKKNDGNGVNFTLLKSPGEFEINCHCTKDEILESLKQLSL